MNSCNVYELASLKSVLGFVQGEETKQYLIENVQLVCYECALEFRKVASPVGRESPQLSKFSKARNMSEKLANVKINGLERKLKQSEVDFMKLIEEQNVTRVLKLKKTRKNNLLTGEWNFLESFRHPH